MSEMHDIFEPGDRIFVTNHSGEVFVYIVRADGALVLVQQPSEAPQ
jgi:hypothetical protein